MRHSVSFFFLFTITLFGLYFILLNFEKNNLKEVKYCKDLGYEKLQKIKPKDFSNFNLKIKFLNEKSWRRINLQDHVQAKKYSEIAYAYKLGKPLKYTNRKRSKAEITLIKEEITCKLEARVRAHGDMFDHRGGSGLPSLNVSLDNGHIFGITKFILFRPHTRNYNNEVFSTTFLSEIGFLSPRTSLVTVEYGGDKKEFIFQERITKEFLEFNNLKEGPIYDGDERFLFMDHVNNLEFKKHKLVNENWIKENKEKTFISLVGFSKLNEIQSTYDAKYTDFVVDYVSFTKKKNNFFRDNEIFDAIVFGTRSEHSLSMNDRMFYYDHNYKKFIPIFYDGNSKLLNKYDQIRNEVFVQDKDLVEKSSLFEGKVSKSSIEGSEEALIKIKNINFDRLHFKLNKRGFQISKEKLTDILNKIEKNLLKLNSFSNSRIFEVNLKDKKRVIEERKSYNDKIERKFVFFDKNFINFLVCKPEDTKNCNSVNNERINLINLLAQKSKNRENQHLVFYGKRDTNDLFNGWYHKNFQSDELSKYSKTNSLILKDLNLILYGDINYDIDENNKIISFTKNSEYGSAFIYKSNLKNWQINFVNNFQNKINSRTDYNFLTGCLNIYDSKFQNTSIISKNSDCEDSINIVRSSGTIKLLSTKRSKFDGVDLDFSNLKINVINVDSSGNDCLDLSYGVYEIKNIKVKKCGDKGVSAGENSNMKIETLNAKEVNIGIASKDYARVFVNNLFLDTVKDCISAYNKKQEFSGGFINVKKMNCVNYKNLEVRDNASKILIN